jgi:hypothetical protein
LEIFKVSEGIRAAVYATGAFSFVFVCMNIVVVLVFWDSSVIRAASRPFVLLLLVFLAMMSVGSVLYAAVPDVSSVGHAICSGRAWTSAWPLTGVLRCCSPRRIESSECTTPQLIHAVVVVCHTTCLFLRVAHPRV